MTTVAPLLVSRRELSYLIDGLLVLYRQMEAVPENDKSELPEIQALTERLMTFPWPS